MEGLKKGIDLIKSEKISEACLYFKQKVSSEPNNDAYWRFYGRVLSDLRLFEKAIFAIEKAISINPEQPTWLYKILVDLKIDFFDISNYSGITDDLAEILSDEQKLTEALGLDEISFPSEIYNGDGVLGKKIAYKALTESRVEFISPFTGEVVSSNKSLTESVYWFDEGFILSFFNDWATPFFSFFQVYLVSENKVLYGSLDPKAEGFKVKKFSDYYSNLLKLLNMKAVEIDNYINNKYSSKVVLKNQNYSHLGHSIWNGPSSLLSFSSDELKRLNVSVFLSAGTIDNSLLTTYSKYFDIIEPPKDIEQFIYKNNYFMVSIKNNYVSRLFTNALLTDSISQNHINANHAMNFRKKHFPIVLLGIRCGTREMLNQEDVLLNVIQGVINKFPQAGFVIDGMNVVASEMNSTHLAIDIKREIELSERLKGQSDCIVNMVSSTLGDNLPWIEICDLCVAPWGAGLAKYKWICNKKTIALASKSVLESKHDLHIYDDDKFMEFSIDNVWLSSEYSNNAEFNSIVDADIGDKGYYYQDFSCDKDEVLKLIFSELENVSNNENFYKFNSLKLFR